MKTRRANLLDIITIAPLAVDYSKEAQKHDEFPFDLEYSMNQIATSMLNGGAVFLVFDSSNEVVGLLWGFCSYMPWCKRKIASDVILYVKPEYRGTRAAYDLCRAYEQWAIDEGAVAIQLSIASGIHEEVTGRFYTRLGYNMIGTQYRKEL